MASPVASHSCAALHESTSEKAKVKSEDAQRFGFSHLSFHLYIKVPNAQVSDTTGDAMKDESWLQKNHSSIGLNQRSASSILIPFRFA